MASKWSFRDQGGVAGELRRALWLRKATRVGKGVTVLDRPFVANEGSLVIGDDVVLSSRPVQSHLVVGPGARLSLGNGSRISYGAAISAQSEVSIGRRTLVGPLVVIMDSDFHVVGDPDAAPPATPISIGDDVVLESRVTVLRGSVIENGARVRSGSVVSGRIAAGSVVSGVPASVFSEELDGLDGGDLRELVKRVLGLPTTPELDHGPDQIPQWDSLGALKLLLAIERTFKVSIPEQELKKAQSIALLSKVVQTARRAQA